MASGDESKRFLVDESQDGLRLDVFLALASPGLSRSQAQKLIRAGFVRVDGVRRPQGFRLKAEMTVRVDLPSETTPESDMAGQSGSAAQLDVLFEDDFLLALNKRPGTVVHPGAGHRTGTLVQALLASGRTLSGLYGPERAGLVHRLDKDTSGVLLVARDDWVHADLQRQFQERTVQKAYLATVLGGKTRDQWEVKTAYARRKTDRKLFTGRAGQGREARTRFRTLLRGEHCALVLAFPKTGRTHQVRVHLAENGHPVVGDRVYGRAYPRTTVGREPGILRKMKRQALHAYALRFTHPITRERVTIVAPLPRDMLEVLEGLFGRDLERVIPKDPFLGKT